jgi:hypothetical protein
VTIEAVTAGAFDVNVTDRMARLLGKIDIQKFLGSDVSATNPILTSLVFDESVIDPRNIRGLSDSDLVTPVGSLVQPFTQRAVTFELLTQLTSGGAEIDPRQIRAITEALARSWTLGSSDVPDLSSRAARLLGIIYGNQDQLQQRATTKELLVQIQHQGSEKDPTQIRALTASDIVAIAREGTPTHFSLSASGTIYTPAAGKKVRLVAFFWSSDADIITSLRFGSGGSDMFPLQKTGVSAMNLLGLGPLQGAADAVLYGYLSGAGNMKGTVFTVEV